MYLILLLNSFCQCFLILNGSFDYVGVVVLG